jgi:hypothetical protein
VSDYNNYTPEMVNSDGDMGYIAFSESIQGVEENEDAAVGKLGLELRLGLGLVSSDIGHIAFIESIEADEVRERERERERLMKGISRGKK